MQRESRLHEPSSGQNAIVDNEQLCPSSVTNASAKLSRSDIPVFAGRSMPKKLLNPRGKFPLSKCKRALLWPRLKRENAIILVEKPPELTGKPFSPQADYSISRRLRACALSAQLDKSAPDRAARPPVICETAQTRLDPLPALPLPHIAAAHAHPAAARALQNVGIVREGSPRKWRAGWPGKIP